MSRGRLGIVWTIALAVGCGGGGDGGVPSGAIDEAPAAPPPAPSAICRSTIAVHPASPVADARARKPLPIAIDLGDDGGMPGARAVKIVLSKAGAPVATILDSSHDLGTLDAALDPALTKDLALGLYSIDATAACPGGATQSTPGAAQTPLFLVHLGVTSIDVGDGDGARVELMYHAVDHTYDNLYPISRATAATLAIPDGESELDDTNGTLRVFAKPWDVLDTPPVDAMGAVVLQGATLPVSLRVGTKPDLVFAVAKKATGLDEPGLPPIRLVADGAPSEPIAAGARSTARLASSPVPSIARVDHDLAWTFEAKTDAGWVEIPGAGSAATLRFYGVLGNTQGTAPPELPWVAVVDDATRAIAGSASDAAGARAALVKHVYEDLGLAYDRVNGASHYTEYANGFGGGSTFVLAHFLARDSGAIVNCSDCASILSTYANMIGAPLSYAILEQNFSLHPIRGIGAKEFGPPFDDGRLAFSYHAVTSSDSSKTIHDATLAVDGDSDPSQAPYTETLLQGMMSAEYLNRLSGDPKVHFTHVDQTTKLDF